VQLCITVRLYLGVAVLVHQCVAVLVYLGVTVLVHLHKLYCTAVCVCVYVCMYVYPVYVYV